MTIEAGKKLDATIVIPVKNGGERLEQVLDMVDRQETEFSYEVVCVDSGSTDDSVAVIRRHNCILKEIAPEEFGHGKTRNLGASLGTGEFILFLTQDAVPADTHWLDEMLKAVKSDDGIAGGFGIHYPYPDCNLPDQLMLQEHFARFGTENMTFEITDENRSLYEEDEGYRQYLAFFSDNNSCLRRSVWERIPYDDVDYAEDQFWARKILEQGYKKVYCPKAGVYHSHNYPLASYGKRYYDDFKAVYRVYGTVLCPDVKAYIRGILGPTKHECGFILRKRDLSLTEKIKWCLYSGIRNCMRCTASVRAVKYFRAPKEQQESMDRRYSQQYLQIKGTNNTNGEKH